MGFSGKIVKNGNVVLPSVVGDYYSTSTGGRIGWNGSFTVPAGSALPTGDYLLVLIDGRSAQILVNQVSYGSHSTTTAVFIGNGPPP